MWIPIRTRIGRPSASLTFARRRERARRRREGNEEGVPLRVDLDPPWCGGLAQQPAVLGECLGVALAPSSWSSRVEPSTSVKRKVTVPVGS